MVQFIQKTEEPPKRRCANSNAKYEEVQEMEYMGLQLELISRLGWMKQIGYSKEGRRVVLFPCPMQPQSTYSANNNPCDTYG